MPRVTCSFCGLPFSVRAVREGVDYYCCSGCALASRIPVHEGQLPVSPGLIAALAVGFGWFNQTLFAVLGHAVIGEGRVATGDRLLWVSCALGAALFLVELVIVFLPKPRRWTDLLAAAGSLGAVLFAGTLLANGRIGAASGWLLAGNTWLALWMARGWARRAWSRARNSRAANST